MTEQPLQPTPMLTPAQVCALLDIDNDRLTAMVKNGLVNAIELGGQYRFSELDVADYIVFNFVSGWEDERIMDCGPREPNTYTLRAYAEHSDSVPLADVAAWLSPVKRPVPRSSTLLVSVTDVAERLNVGEDIVRGITSANGMEHVRIGDRTYFTESDVRHILQKSFAHTRGGQCRSRVMPRAVAESHAWVHEAFDPVPASTLPMSLTRASARLGVERATLQAMVTANEIRYVDDGANVYLTEDDLTDFIARSKVDHILVS